MEKDAQPRVWPWFLIGILGIAIFLFRSIEISVPSGDGRPIGTVEDIEKLAERDDINVLFLLIDTLRADHLSLYGYERETSPFLDQLAYEGITFANNTSQSSWTKASMASLWSGLYPVRAGVTKYNHGIAEEAVLPAEILNDAGFQTIGLYRNGWVSGYFGFKQGFDKYYRPIGEPLPAHVRRANPNLNPRGSDDDVVNDAIEFIRIKGRDQRWFVYAHWMDLHEYTYDEESAVFGTSNADIYDNSIRLNNNIFQDFYNSLASLGVLDKTIIVIASDHGEAFGERGFEGHAREVFPESVWTPLVISLPFRLDQGIVVEERTANVDLWPTILDMVGLSMPDDIDGRSRLDAILAAGRGEAREPQDESAIAHLDQNWGRPGEDPKPTISVVDGRYRLVIGIDSSGQDSEVLLDLADGEVENIIESEPDIAADLRDQANAHLEEPVLWSEGSPELEIDEMELNQLRALGYQLP